MGYHVLTPDLRASGLSGGRYLTLGYRESEDIVLWARRIAQENPQAKIILHGVSMGAATVMMAAGREDLPPEVVAVVEDCGYTNADELIALQMENSFGLPSFPAMNLLNWRCEKMAGFSLKDASPIDAVRHARVPLLFIHGTKDTLVPPNMAEKLYAAANAPKKELLMIPGAVHAAASQADQQTDEGAHADHCHIHHCGFGKAQQGHIQFIAENCACCQETNAREGDQNDQPEQNTNRTHCILLDIKSIKHYNAKALFCQARQKR